MFDSVHHFLYDNNVWLVPLALVTAAFFAYRIWRIVHTRPVTESLSRPTGRRTPRPMPAPAEGAKPVQQQFIADKAAPPASVTAGEESRKHKGLAPTLRIRSDDQRPSTIGGSTTEVMPPRGEDQTVGDEVGKLFAGLDDTLKPATESDAQAAPKSSDSQRRATRLESLGFHHSIESLKTPPPGSIVAPPEHPAPATAAAATPPAPAQTAPAGPTQGAPALDDILARLDRVLADDQPAKPGAGTAARAATPPPAGEAKPVAGEAKPIVKAPMWARADAQDEELDAKPADPGQQLGLFDEDKKA